MRITRPQLLALEGDEPKHYPLFPVSEYSDYNPAINDFLGWSIKSAAKKVSSSVSNVASNVSNQIATIKKQVEQQKAALQSQLQAQIDRARAQVEAQATALKQQAKDLALQQLQNQKNKLKEQLGNKIVTLVKNPAFQDAIIISASTALGQPTTGLAIVTAKRAIMTGDYSQAMAYAAQKGGLSEEDMQWVNDTMNMSDQFLIDNQEFLKQDAFDLSQLFPGQNIPENTIIKAESPGQSMPNKKTLMIAGGAAAGILAIYFMTKR